MSTTDFNRFMAEAGSDPEAAKAFVLAVGDRQGDDAVRAVAAFAQARGYAVTAEDAARHRQSLLAGDAGGDLEDHELEGVEGGAVVEGVLMVAGLAAALGVVVGTVAVPSTIGAVLSNPDIRGWFAQW